MGRPKKDAIVLHMKIDREVSKMLDEYCNQTGQSKTTAVERILLKEIKEYFNQPEGKRIPA
jgi:hypothetical protein